MELFSKIAEYTKNAGIDEMISVSSGVVCAFSGGADSSVLLRFLKNYLKEKNVPLYAAHMNHMIRGAESDSDEAFCRRVCAELDVPLSVMRADIPAAAEKTGKGLEETARNERYKFLLSVKEKSGASLVATAHSASDNLESVIFNLVRGSATGGMSGISPVRDGVFIRPLLSCTAEEIREFAKCENIPFVVDSTNKDTAYTRNFIRANIVPEMKKMNPKVEAAALRLSAAARSDCAFIENEAKKTIGNGSTCKRDVFRTLDGAVKSRVIALMYKMTAGTPYDLSAVNIGDCVSLASCKGNGSISLPGGVTFCAHKDAVFMKNAGKDEALPEKTELCKGEITAFGDFAVGLYGENDEVPEKYENIYNLFIKETLDCDKIKSNLHVRIRKTGDRFLLRGVNRSLKKLMCDENIPQRDRDHLPLICDSDGIILVPTLPPRDGAGAGKDTKVTVTVCIYRK